jgi:predicted TIM-barrel fold metal-dependent hydrolase
MDAPAMPARAVPDGPTGLVDAHFHVVAPLERAPMASARSYTPAPASLDGWRACLAPLGVTHGVVVQPSFYGTDNRVLLQALADGGEALVGVAAVDADISDEALDRLAAARVRGVRLAHVAPGDGRALGGFVDWAAFEALEPRLLARGLHVQLLTDSRLLPALADRLARSRVPVVIDHMGRTPARFGVAHPGFAVLAELMRTGPVWTKLSGIANLSTAAPGYEDVRQVHEALLGAAPDRLVWGSDWPHTRPAGERPRTEGLMQRFHEWTPAALRRRITWDNPARLYRL